MNGLQLLSITFLVALGSTLVKLEPCSMHKVQITCSRVSNITWGLGYFPSCAGSKSIVSTNPGSSVSSIVYSNGLEVENLSQVGGFFISTAKMKFIPSGIGSRLKNLKVINIHQCGLLSVSKENLKEFGVSLEYLILRENNITFIDADLLEYSFNLKTINLDGNPIRYIEPEFFINLMKLRIIRATSVVGVSCMAQDFKTSASHNITTLKWNNEQCLDETARTETRKLISEALCDEAKMSELVTQMFATRTANERSNQMNQIMNDMLKSSGMQIVPVNKLTEENSELREQIKDLKSKTDLLEKKMDTLVNMVTHLVETADKY